MGIQNYLIEKKIQVALKKSAEIKHQTAFVNLNDIAIFVDEKSVFNEGKFRDLQRIIELDETHFNILTFKEKKSSYNEFRGTVLSQSEINWQGKIKSKEVQDFLTKQEFKSLFFFAIFLVSSRYISGFRYRRERSSSSDLIAYKPKR